MVIVTRPVGCEAFDAVVIVPLISFADESDIGCTWDARNISLLDEHQHVYTM